MSMRAGSPFAVIVLALLMLLLPGCKKKQPAAPPPQAQAPEVTEPQPPPAPEAQAETTPLPEPSTEEAPAASAPPAKPAAPKKPSAAKPKANGSKTVAKKTEPPPPPRKPPAVVQEGGAAPNAGQLSVGGSHNEQEHQRASTAQLLDSAEANLKSVTRSLNSDEQAMVQQIRNYMRQSRDATTQGDGERAYNLALKAHLLSDELTTRR
jgi:hypothetical protein